MFSQTVLAGRLGRDPEVRTTSSGKRVLTLRLCTQTTVRGRVLTEWHAVTAWSEALIELMVERLHKGDLILVTGQNRTRKIGQGDDARSLTEVVMGPQDQVRFLNVRGGPEASPEEPPR